MTAGTMAGATARADLLKLRKRPGTWVLGGILIVSVVLFGYLLNYLLLATLGEEAQMGPAVDTADLLLELSPARFLRVVLDLAGLAGPVALVFGALAVGSEYGWGTWKTLATQRPPRGTLGAGKILAVVAVLAIYTVAIFFVAALSSVLIAAVEGMALTWPGPWDVLRGLGAFLLVLAVWAALGMLLAGLFRGTGLAIGLGLVYALALETVVATLPFDNRILEVVQQGLISTNTAGLGRAFGEPLLGMPDPTAPAPGLAAAVLAVYAVALFAGYAALVASRDVT